MKYAVIDTLFNLKVGSERVVLTGEKFLEIVQQVSFCTTKFTLSEMTPKFEVTLQRRGVEIFHDIGNVPHFFQEVITGVPVARFKKSRCQMKDMDIVFLGASPKFL